MSDGINSFIEAQRIALENDRRDFDTNPRNLNVNDDSPFYQHQREQPRRREDQGQQTRMWEEPRNQPIRREDHGQMGRRWEEPHGEPIIGREANDQAQPRRKWEAPAQLQPRGSYSTFKEVLLGSGVVPTLVYQPQNEMGEYKENVPPSLPPPFSRLPHKPSTPDAGLVSKLGQYEQKRLKLREERKQEYNQLLAEKNRLRVARPRPTDNRNTLEDDNVAGADPRQDRPPPPRKGWGTPTPSYEEILEKKRKEEKNYRRYDDPDLFDHRPAPVAAPTRVIIEPDYSGALAYNEGLNQFDEDDRRLRELERDFDARKVRFMEERRRGLDDSHNGDFDWPADNQITAARTTRRARSRSNPERPAPLPRHIDEDNYISSSQSQQPRPPNTRPLQNNIHYNNHNNSNVNNNYDEKNLESKRIFGVIPGMGKQMNPSEEQSKKAEYGRELQRQMEVDKANRRKDKVAAQQPEEGFLTSSGNRGRPPLPSHVRATSRERDNYTVSPPTSTGARQTSEDGRQKYLDSVSSRAGGGPVVVNTVYDPHQYMMSTQSGLNGSYLISQPGGYPVMSPVEEAYRHYGMHDPLAQGGDQWNRPLFDPPPARPSLITAYAPPPGPSALYGMSPGHLVHPVNALAQQYESPSVAFGRRGSDEEKKQDLEKNRMYQLELEKQILADKLKKQQDKKDQEMREKKLEREIAEYDPFGRGGGGAPLKDKFGNVITSRKMGATATATGLTQPLQHNTDIVSDERTPVTFDEDPSSYLVSTTNPSPTTIRGGGGQGVVGGGGGVVSEGHARGGNGIFGEPATDAQKNSQQRYQEELKLQVLEKQRRAAEEKEKERLEEEKLVKRIEEDNRKKAQEELEEKKKIQLKAEQAEKQADELRRRQEEERKESERKKKEAADARSEAYRKQLDEEQQKKLAEAAAAANHRDEERGRTGTEGRESGLRGRKEDVVDRRSERGRNDQIMSPVVNNNNSSEPVVNNNVRKLGEAAAAANHHDEKKVRPCVVGKKAWWERGRREDVVDRRSENGKNDQIMSPVVNNNNSSEPVVNNNVRKLTEADAAANHRDEEKGRLGTEGRESSLRGRKEDVVDRRSEHGSDDQLMSPFVNNNDSSEPVVNINVRKLGEAAAAANHHDEKKVRPCVVGKKAWWERGRREDVVDRRSENGKNDQIMSPVVNNNNSSEPVVNNNVRKLTEAEAAANHRDEEKGRPGTEGCESSLRGRKEDVVDRRSEQGRDDQLMSPVINNNNGSEPVVSNKRHERRARKLAEAEAAANHRDEEKGRPGTEGCESSLRGRKEDVVDRRSEQGRDDQLMSPVINNNNGSEPVVSNKRHERRARKLGEAAAAANHHDEKKVRPCVVGKKAWWERGRREDVVDRRSENGKNDQIMSPVVNNNNSSEPVVNNNVRKLTEAEAAANHRDEEKGRPGTEGRESSLRGRKEDVVDRRSEHGRDDQLMSPFVNNNDSSEPVVNNNVRKLTEAAAAANHRDEEKGQAGAEVLGQLARMKQQLQSERHRVETDLKKEQMDDIYDARSTNRKLPLRDTMNNGGMDTNRDPLSVRRWKVTSREQLRRMFPNSPTNNNGDVLDQRARLFNNQQQINNYDMLPITEMDDRQSNPSPKVLKSVSAFIDVPPSPDRYLGSGRGGGGGRERGGGEMPDDLEDLTRDRRASGARSRRRNQHERTPTPRQGTFGSQTSLDPDAIKLKNEERLRNLRAYEAGDTLSTADPDDVLKRFVARQQHRRASSSATLNDDTWLEPGR